MSKKFNKGDVVVLNSGGPKMTVTGYTAELMSFVALGVTEKTVSLQWYNDKANKFETSAFDEDLLDFA
ncbi:DUF2158 domain-containing protein [uncultured Pantoea sp.]|uniref:YodC family protein n=1 Tax=uncultured Pantoea sp. TaxID=218084 RepID=UPI002805E81B|nr:DUF2158 domain-containing protein [uncultured Pantoea sp.]